MTLTIKIYQNLLTIMELSDRINRLPDNDRLKLLMFLSDMPAISDETLGKLIESLDKNLTDVGITPEIWTTLSELLTNSQ